MHIKSAADLEPQSEGIANRAAESITIIGNVLEDLLNGLGGALADVTGSNHGSHLNINRKISFADANPSLSPVRAARARRVSAEVPRDSDPLGDADRVDKFIDTNRDPFNFV